MGLGGQLARPVDAELAHVGPLPVALIAALWLSKCKVRAGHVEYVVDDLEQQPQLGGERAVGLLRRVGEVPVKAVQQDHRPAFDERERLAPEP